MTDEERADDFLHKVHPQYYGEVVATLDQHRLLGLGGYPKTVEEAYTILSQWSFKPAVSRPVMNQSSVFSSEISTDNNRRTQRNKSQTLKTEWFDELWQDRACGKRLLGRRRRQRRPKPPEEFTTEAKTQEEGQGEG